MEELFISLTMRCKVLKEPTLSSLPNGTPATRFPAVVNRRYKDASGEAHESSEYFQVVCYGPLAENVNQYVTPQQVVTVFAESIKADHYITSNGEERTTPIIKATRVFFGPRPDNTPGQDPPDEGMF